MTATRAGAYDLTEYSYHTTYGSAEYLDQTAAFSEYRTCVGILTQHSESAKSDTLWSKMLQDKEHNEIQSHQVDHLELGE